MQIITTIAEMREACRDLRSRHSAAAELALVPTMGAIHAGHLSLVRAARREASIITASLFVNPLQFGPTEDLDRYPRSFDEDCRLLAEAGVDLLFAPTADAMYPTGATTLVDVPALTSRLDGASRPGHLCGVSTVVAKLFHIVQPDLALFGQKDAAQAAVITAMVRDLNLRVRLRICPIVRDTDGLALSSRNRYLSPAERREALVLPRTLFATQSRIADGETDASMLREAILAELDAAPGIRIDYVEIVDPATLQPVSTVTSGALIAAAIWTGSTRLIDNLLVDPTPRPAVWHPEAEVAHA